MTTCKKCGLPYQSRVHHQDVNGAHAWVPDKKKAREWVVHTRIGEDRFLWSEATCAESWVPGAECPLRKGDLPKYIGHIRVREVLPPRPVRGAKKKYDEGYTQSGDNLHAWRRPKRRVNT